MKRGGGEHLNTTAAAGVGRFTCELHLEAGKNSFFASWADTPLPTSSDDDDSTCLSTFVRPLHPAPPASSIIDNQTETHTDWAAKDKTSASRDLDAKRLGNQFFGKLDRPMPSLG